MRGQKAPQGPRKIQESQGWPQASRLAECAEDPRVKGWGLGGGQLGEYWGAGEGACCDQG